MSEGEAEGAVVTAGRQLADGSGVLGDGTRWEKKSGIEYGKVSGRVGGGGGEGASDEDACPDAQTNSCTEQVNSKASPCVWGERGGGGDEDSGTGIQGRGRVPLPFLHAALHTTALDSKPDLSPCAPPPAGLPRMATGSAGMC
jgi:hypothetical protein